jgi:tight adherence protein C
MLTMVFGFFSFLFFTCLGFLLFHRLYRKKMVIYRRVSPLLSNQSDSETIIQLDEIKQKTLYERLIQPQIGKFRRLAEGKFPKHKMTLIENRLQAAGYPFGLSAGDFVLLQTLLPIVMLLLFIFLLVPAADEKGKIIVLAFIGASFVYIYPSYYLGAKSKQRTKLIDKSMPDFFDMLNVSIEAGMGLDGALKKVCNQIDSPLSKEFLSTLEDMKLGKSRRQAFSELRDRIPSEFFRSVMGSIIQADQMGIGMSKVLRTQSQRIREKQRFQAKEQAMKAPVKMLIPMVFFIFPTLFIVLIGPVIINVVTQFM